MASVNWTNVTDWQGVLQGANTNTDGYFWMMILWGVWIVTLIISSVFGFEAGLLLASFIGLIFGLFLVYAGLVAWPWLLSFVGILLIVILYISWSGKKE